MDSEGEGSCRDSSSWDSNRVASTGPAAAHEFSMQINGSFCAHEYNDDHGAFNASPNGSAPHVDEKNVDAELQADSGSHPESNHLASDASTSIPVTKAADPATSPGIPVLSPPETSNRGKGLRKWRRIKREQFKDGSSTPDPGKNLKRALRGSEIVPSSVPIPEMREESMGGSPSSTNAIINNKDAAGDDVPLPLHGFDSGYKLELERSTFSAGIDSDHSEDRSSKLSAAASSPMYRSKHLQGGKSTGIVAQRMQQGKVMVGTSKKPRGGRVNIGEGKLLYSLELDYISSISINSEVNLGAGPLDCEGEPGVYALASGEQDAEDLPAPLSESAGDAEYSSRGDAQSHWEDQRKNYQGTISWDPLVESVIMLQSAQDALEIEIGKFGEIGKELNSFGEESRRAMDLQIQLEEVKGILKEKEMKIAVLEAVMDDSKHKEFGREGELKQAKEIDTELEDFYKQRIEAEVEQLVITSATGSWITLAKNRIKILDEQRTLSQEQGEAASTIGDAKRKANLLKTRAEEFDAYCQEILGAEEVFKMQKEVIKLTACFFMQLVLVVLVFGLVFLHLLSDSTVITPT